MTNAMGLVQMDFFLMYSGALLVLAYALNVQIKLTALNVRELFTSIIICVFLLAPLLLMNWIPLTSVLIAQWLIACFAHLQFVFHAFLLIIYTMVSAMLNALLIFSLTNMGNVLCVNAKLVSHFHIFVSPARLFSHIFIQTDVTISVHQEHTRMLMITVRNAQQIVSLVTLLIIAPYANKTMLSW